MFQQHDGDVHVSVEQGVMQRTDSTHLAVEHRGRVVTQQSLHTRGAAVVARFMQGRPASVIYQARKDKPVAITEQARLGRKA